MDLKRVVQTWSPHISRAATGYLVADRLVLTAWHAIAAAGPVEGLEVRVFDEDGRTTWMSAERVWPSVPPDLGAHPEHDAALLEITDPRWAPPTLAPVRWGRIAASEMEHVPCRAVAFPRAHVRADARREPKDIAGVIERYTGQGSGLLAVQVTSSVPRHDQGWAGASGAGLHASGLLIGVLAEDRRPEYAGDHLRAVSLADLARNSDLAQEFLQRSGVPMVFEDAVGPSSGKSEPVRLPRVCECRPLALGIHASIPVVVTGGASGGSSLSAEMPHYVARDIDERLRSAVAAAAEHSGLIVLVGDSSTGKSRCAFEAIRSELPDWPLLHPAGADQLTAAIVEGSLPAGGTVIWLDEFHHYLTGPGALTIDTVQSALNRGGPTVVMATMWLDWFNDFTGRPPKGNGAEDPYWHARRILEGTPDVIFVSEFTEQERARARELAERDPRLAVALDDQDFGVTQVLAGAPQLVRRWEKASDPYARALITGAVDCRRTGMFAPLSDDLLSALAPGYLSPRQIAEAPADWFRSAVEYATAELVGQTSVLMPVPGGAMGSTVGYTVTDYIVQHGSRVRATTPGPAELWDAMALHAHDPGDLGRIGEFARRRMHYAQAEDFLSRAAPANPTATASLTALLIEQRRIDEALELKRTAAAQGAALEMNADSDLVIALADRGRLDEAVEHAAGNSLAGNNLATWLEREGDANAAIAVCRTAAENGFVSFITTNLATMLRKQGRFDEAAEQYYIAIQHADPTAPEELVSMLADVGRTDEAVAGLQDLAEHVQFPSHNAWARAIDMFTELGRGEEALQAYHAALNLEHETDCLRYALQLAKHGRPEDAKAVLKTYSEQTGFTNYHVLCEVLLALGENEQQVIEVYAALSERDAWARQKATRLLLERGEQDQALALNMTALANGHAYAHNGLAECLVKLGRVDEALAVHLDRIKHGVFEARTAMVRMLAENDRVDFARLVRRYGIQLDGTIVVPEEPDEAGQDVAGLVRVGQTLVNLTATEAMGGMRLPS